MTATQQSWNGEFRGYAHVRLRKFMEIALRAPSSYARYCAIIQSSGMGKSRLTDQIAKEVLTIPINLRSRGTEGLLLFGARWNKD